MPDWVQITGEDVVMITFACCYVLAGIGMYLGFLRNRSSLSRTRSDILYFLTRRLQAGSKPASSARWFFRSA